MADAAGRVHRGRVVARGVRSAPAPRSPRSARTASSPPSGAPRWSATPPTPSPSRRRSGAAVSRRPGAPTWRPASASCALRTSARGRRPTSGCSPWCQAPVTAALAAPRPACSPGTWPTGCDVLQPWSRAGSRASSCRCSTTRCSPSAWPTPSARAWASTPRSSSTSPSRTRGRGYYGGFALRITAEQDTVELGDGGLTSWTAQLTQDAKERCLVSCIATETAHRAAGAAIPYPGRHGQASCRDLHRRRDLHRLRYPRLPRPAGRVDAAPGVREARDDRVLHDRPGGPPPLLADAPRDVRA